MRGAGVGLELGREVLPMDGTLVRTTTSLGMTQMTSKRWQSRERSDTRRENTATVGSQKNIAIRRLAEVMELRPTRMENHGVTVWGEVSLGEVAQPGMARAARRMETIPVGTTRSEVAEDHPKATTQGGIPTEDHLIGIIQGGIPVREETEDHPIEIIREAAPMGVEEVGHPVEDHQEEGHQGEVLAEVQIPMEMIPTEAEGLPEGRGGIHTLEDSLVLTHSERMMRWTNVNEEAGTLSS
jgi:hypothetical protein